MPGQEPTPASTVAGPEVPEPPAEPDPEDRLDRLIDLQSAGSFPASDPPSFWAGAS